MHDSGRAAEAQPERHERLRRDPLAGSVLERAKVVGEARGETDARSKQDVAAG